MLLHLLTRRILNIPFLLFSFTVFKGVSCHHLQYGRRLPPTHFVNRRYSDSTYFLPEECYGSYPRKPHYCSTPEEQDKNVYYFIPEIVVPTTQTSYAYHVSSRPKPRGPPRFPNLSQIKRRYHKFWLKFKPKFIYFKNKLAELPPPVKAIPILMTVARTAMMVKSQIDEIRKLQHELEESEEESVEATSPLPPLDPITDAELEKQAKQDKIQLDTQIVGLVAESLNLASNKLSLINTLAKTAMVAGRFAARDDLGDALEESDLLDQITDKDNSIIDELRKHHVPSSSSNSNNSKNKRKSSLNKS